MNNWLKIGLILLMAFHFNSLIGQSQDSSFIIYGQVIDEKSKEPIPNVHVINKTTFVGTVTNGQGFFHMEITYFDTLIFSNLGYAYSYYRHSKDKEGQVIIALKEKNYLLEEVSVYTYQMTSNDPKPMNISKPMIPRNEDINYPDPVKPTLANPVDLLYYMFGSRPRQMRKLRELQIQDQYRHMLKEGNNREILTELTGMDKDELEAFMFFCKYSRTQINTMNDYDFLLSLMNCYEEYLRIQEREQILREKESKPRETQTKERFK